MKVYIKLLAFLSILLGSFCLLAVYVMSDAEEDVVRVQQQLEEREGVVIDNIMDLKRSNMHTFAWDYSWWQDLIDWMEAPELDWLEDQFDQVLYTYDVGFFAVYDATGARVSPVYGPDLVATTVVELPEQLSQEILTRPQALLYEASFEQRSEGLLELYYAPVVPQEDIARSGKHYGYLVVGRFWDEPYLSDLEAVTGAEMTLLSEAPEEHTTSIHDVWNGVIHLERSLDNYKGEQQAVLLITKFLPVSKRIVDAQREGLFFILIAAVVTVLALVFFVLYVVTRPLKHLSDAMEFGNFEQLSKLERGRSEFRHLAELILEHYAQRERLEDEVSLRRATEGELKRSRDLAECASRAKSQFLANMSHETRTPLHTISGYAALLEDSDLDGEQKQSLAFIRESSDHLVQMLNDIIELSSMEAAQLHPQKKWFELKDLFYEVASAGENMCLESPLSFQSDFQRDMPRMIHADYERLRRLLLNLLDNAIKFTHHGLVAVRFECEQFEGKHRVCIRIEDTGIGIPVEDIERVFEAFYLVDDSDSRSQQGGGLGLAVAKGLSGILEADLEVESTVGKGSVFQVVMLLNPADVRFEPETVDGNTHI